MQRLGRRAPGARVAGMVVAVVVVVPMVMSMVMAMVMAVPMLVRMVVPARHVSFDARLPAGTSAYGTHGQSTSSS